MINSGEIMKKVLMHKDKEGNVYCTHPASKESVQATHSMLHESKESLVAQLQKGIAHSESIGHVHEVARLNKKLEVINNISDIHDMTDDEFLAYVEADIHPEHIKVGWHEAQSDKRLRNAWYFDDNGNHLVSHEKAQQIVIKNLAAKLMDSNNAWTKANLLDDAAAMATHYDKMQILKAQLANIKALDLANKFSPFGHSDLDIFHKALEA